MPPRDDPASSPAPAGAVRRNPFERPAAAGTDMLFNEIRAFRAVMRAGSMTKGGASMHMSQPNISRLVSRLEDKTGLVLFSRLPGKLVPTQEAVALYQDVERLFVGLESLELSVDNIRKFGNGRLRIASVPSLAFGLLPKSIALFDRETPDVPISIHTDSTSMVVRWVASRFCDFGLVSYIDDAHVGTQATDVRVQGTMDLEAACILPRDHPLRGEPVITPQMLARTSFISMAPSDPLRAKVDRAFQPRDERNLLYDTPFAATICQMVGMGLGVSIVNPLVASATGDPGVLLKRFEPSIVFSSHVIVPGYGPENGLVARFLDAIRVVLDRELAEVARLMGGAGR